MKTENNMLTGNRQTAELVMQTSLQLLPLIMNNIPQAVFWKGRNLVYLGCNQAFADDAGVSTPDEIIGKTDFEMPWKNQAELYRADDRQVMESGKPKLNYEEPQTTPDGSTIWLSTSKIPVYENGKVVAILGMYEDVTARKQSEKTLQESEDRFRRFTEATVEGLVFHEQGSIIDANPAALNMFGLSNHTEFIGKSLLEFLKPESHAMVLKQMQLESVAPYEVQCIRKDGSTFPVETSTRTYKDGNRTIRATSIRDITKRKQAEVALRENQSLYQSLVEGSPLSICRKDLEGRFTFANQRFLEVSQTTLTDLVGKTDLDLHPSELAEKYRRDDLDIMESGKVHEIIEERAIHEGGTSLVQTIKAPTYDGNGKVNGIQISFWDITDRKRAEEALQESEERFRRFTEVTSEGLIFHEQGRIVDGNPAALALFGFSNDKDLIGRNLLEFITPELHELVLKKMQSETVLPYEVQGIRKDGSTFPVETATRTYKIGERSIRVSTLHDITERKRVEQALEGNRRLLQLVMDNIPQAVFWKDKDLTYLGTNQAFAEDAGFSSPEDLIGKSDFDMPWKEQAELYRADDRRVLALGEPKLNYEEPQTSPTGEVTWLRTSKIPMRDVNGKIFAVLGMYEDITEWKRLQQNVQEGYERRGYQVEIGTQISQEIAAASELSELFDRVVTLTKERLGYYHTQLLRYDAVQDAVVLIKGYGETGQKMLAGGHKLPMGTGLIGTAADNGQTVMRSTLAEDPDWKPNPLLPETRGEIAVPIKWQDTVLGVLDVQSNKAGALAEDDRQLLEGLCGQIAIAMRSAELVETVRQDEARLTEALRAARLANWEYDVEKDNFIFNDQFYSIFHTTAEKVGGYRLSSARYAELFVHPDDLEFVRKEIGKSLSSTERVFNNTVDHRILYGDGGIGYITAKVTVEHDENGKITRYYGANQDITERKQAEEALRINEARLAEALQIARLAHWEYDVEKDIFTFNDQFYSLFHTTAEQHGGYQLPSAYYAQHFVYPEDLPVVGVEIEKALNSTGRHYSRNIEHRMLYADGSIGHIQVNINVDRDENGKITRYYGANQDITERKQAEEALRINEARLAEALRAARLGNWEYDFENDLFIFTDDFYSIFRTTAERVGGYKISSADYAKHFVHPDDAPLVGIEIQKVLDAKDRLFTTHLEHRIIFADGEIGYIAVNINVERDENGKITRWYGANQDITERKQAEEALRINEARLAEALQIARLAHWEYDVEKDIFTFNDQFYSLFHTTAEQHGGYQLPSAYYAQHFVYPEDLPVVGVEIEKALNSTGRHYSRNIEHRILYADGGIGHMQVNINVDRDENGKITRYYGANQEITERKQAEEALRQSEARLTEALHAAKLAYWEHNLATNQFELNDQYYAICHTTAEQEGGYTMSPEHMLGRFIYPEDHALINQAIAAGLQSTDRHYRSHVDHRIIYADGSGIGYAAIETNIERDEEGHITRIYGSYQDITERVKQQQELAERLEEINRLYQNLSHEGWKSYRDTANLPSGFMFDQSGTKPVEGDVLEDGNFASIPVRVLGGEVVGTLAVANDPLNPTSPEDLVFLQQVSDQIALAMESARLSAQTQSALAQSEILFEASKNLAQAADLQELVKTVVETLHIPVMNRAHLETFNYDAAGELVGMTLAATWWNGTGQKDESVGRYVPADVLKNISLFSSPTPMFINDPLHDERIDAVALQMVKAQNIRALTVLPLLLGTRPLGMLILTAEEPYSFTEDETRLFTALAPQISTVLENRRQFERAQQQAERESTLNIISQKIQSATTVEAVLQIAARELGHALGAPMTIAQLSLKDKK